MNNRQVTAHGGLGVEGSLHKRHDSAPVVKIPARDYDIDCSELEITCCSSNSRAPGGSCATYNIEPSETLDTLHHVVSTYLPLYQLGCFNG